MLIAFNFFAQEIGRYQAIPIPKGQGDANHVLIIETRKGHIRGWSEYATLYNANGSVTSYGSRNITYQGKVRPGKKIGDIIEKQEFGKQ